jgi:hypothetical protein
MGKQSVKKSISGTPIFVLVTLTGLMMWYWFVRPVETPALDPEIEAVIESESDLESTVADDGADFDGDHKTGGPKSLKDVHGSQKLELSNALIGSYERLISLERCYRTQTCKFSEETPRSTHEKVEELLVNELSKLHDQVRKDPRLAPDAAAINRYFLYFPEDYVKAKALEGMSLFAATPAQLKSILNGLEDSASAPLYEQGLGELSRYVGTPLQTEVDRFIIKTIKTGPPFAAMAVARGALPFLNQENLSEYSNLLRELPADSRAQLDLKLNIREFEKMLKGG